MARSRRKTPPSRPQQQPLPQPVALDLPPAIDLGDLAADRPAQASRIVSLPAPATAACDLPGLDASLAMHGVPGQWLLTLRYDRPRADTLLHARLTIAGATFSESIWVLGRVLEPVTGGTPQQPAIPDDEPIALDSAAREHAASASDETSAPLQALRIAMHTGAIDAAIDQLARQPHLAHFLTPPEQRAIAEARARTSWLASLRDALLESDEREAVRLGAIPHMPLHLLRDGEQAQLTWLIDKHAALPRLRDAITHDSSAMIDDYWSALAAGIRIPAPLADRVRAARLRHSRDQRPESTITLPVFTSVAPAAADPLSPPPPAGAAAEDPAAAYLHALTVALESGPAEHVIAAADALKEFGLPLPRIAYERYLDAVAQRRTLTDLHAALANNDAGNAARLWATARSRWPDALDPAADTAGQAAFRHWGASLRRHTTGA